MSTFSVRRLTKKLSLGTILVPIILATALTACSTKKSSVGSHSGGSDGTVSASQAQAEVQKWGAKYASKPDDRDIAISYASALRRNNQLDQSVAVLRKAMIKHQNDRTVAAAYGKALAAKGDFDSALKVIRSAHSPDQPDWRLLSAEGAILDQTGDNARARALYQQALKITPNEPSILNNLGLSYALSGDLNEAESVLRRAVAQPRADSRVRQNLALVLGLQGKFDEAEKIAMDELSPEQARENMAYIRGMLSERNSWDRVQSKKKSG